MPDEPQIVRDFRRLDPRNAVPDEQGGNAAARRAWNGPEPHTCRLLGCTERATGVARMRYEGVVVEVPICAVHSRVLLADFADIRHVSIG